MVGLCNEPSPDFQRLAEPRFLFGLGKDFAEPRFFGLGTGSKDFFGSVGSFEKKQNSDRFGWNRIVTREPINFSHVNFQVLIFHT